jgi:hypothetical protein
MTGDPGRTVCQDVAHGTVSPGPDQTWADVHHQEDES